ncbi:MAG: AgmX/PglI C-terminal domain-containing protein [Polyangiaceae bacterium]|nr:AgmX/PglI C-terminal domain-containing protein [Polyangiaceae bacterium]
MAPPPARLVASLRDELRACYVRARARDPKLVGNGYLAFLVEADGRVARSWNYRPPTANDDATLRCIHDRVRVLRFPRPPGGRRTIVSPVGFVGSGPRTPASAPATRRQ